MPSAVPTYRRQAKILRPVQLRGKEVTVELGDDRVHKAGALERRRQTVAGGFKFLPDLRGFRCVQIPEG